MAEYQLSLSCAATLEDIFVYTAERYGLPQAEAYHEGFHRIFGLLADFPMMGQSADEYRSGLRKFRYQSHMVFYTYEAHIVTIQHIIHHRQDVRRHMLDE